MKDTACAHNKYLNSIIYMRGLVSSYVNDYLNLETNIKPPCMLVLTSITQPFCPS